MNNEKLDENDDEEPEEEITSLWEDKMLFQSKEHTRLLKTINTAVQIIGLIVILSAILGACSALRLI